MEIVPNKFIYLTDVHYSEHNPRAWKADYSGTLLANLDWVFNYANENNIGLVVHGGDLGHRYNWDSVMLTKFIDLRHKYSNIKFWTIIGNHDTIGKNVQNIRNTGLNILAKDPNILEIINDDLTRPGHTPSIYGNYEFYGYHSDWYKTEELLKGEEYLDEAYGEVDDPICVAVIHAAVGAESTPYCKGIKDVKVGGFDLALFGDIHNGWEPVDISWDAFENKTMAFNPGSFGRRTVEDSKRATKFIVFEGRDFKEVEVPNLANEELFNFKAFKPVTISKAYLEAMSSIKSFREEDLTAMLFAKAKELNLDEYIVRRIVEKINPQSEL